jgi:hypothetical protein
LAETSIQRDSANRGGEDFTPDKSGSLAQHKRIEAPQAILTLGKHGLWTAEMFCASQL